MSFSFLLLRGRLHRRARLREAVCLKQLLEIPLETLLYLLALDPMLHVRQLRRLFGHGLLHVLLARRLGRRLLRHEDEMPTERRLDGRVELADFLLERGLVELRNHLSVAKGTEVAVRPFTRGAVGIPLRKLPKLLREALALQPLQLLVQRVDLLLGGIARLFLVRLDEDVRCTHLLRLGRLRPLRDVEDDGVVLFLDLGGIYRDLGRDFLIDEFLDADAVPELRARAHRAQGMLLEHFGLAKEGALIRKAVNASLDANVRTPEIQVEGGACYGTREVGEWIVNYIMNN